MEASEIIAELHNLETFSLIFDEFARSSTYKEYLDYVNCIISMISMQFTKIRNLIEIAEKLEGEHKV